MPWVFDSELRQIRHLLSNLDKRMNQVASIDDLNAAVTKISDAVTKAVADIQAQAQAISQANQASGANDPAIEAAAQQISTLADNLNNAVAPAAPTT